MKKHGFVFVLPVFLLLLTAGSGPKSSDSLGKDSVSPSSYSTQYSADSPEEFKKALRAFGYYDVEEFEELLRERDLPTEGYLDGYRDSDPKYSSDKFRFGVMLKQLNCKGLIDEQDHSTLYIVRNMTERTQELCWYLFDWDLDNTGKELVYLTFPDPAIAKTTFNWAISGLEDSMNSEEHMVITTKDAYSRATLIEQDEEDKEDGWAFSMVLVQDGNHLILYVGPVYCHAYQLFDFLGYTQDSSDLLGEPVRTENPETVSDFEPTPEPEPEDKKNYDQALTALNDKDYFRALEYLRQAGNYADAPALTQRVNICYRASVSGIQVPDLGCFVSTRHTLSAAGSSGNGIYLRKCPTVAGMSNDDIRANIIRTLPVGTKMTSWASLGGFYLVELEDESLGWVDSTKVDDYGSVT